MFFFFEKTVFLCDEQSMTLLTLYTLYDYLKIDDTKFDDFMNLLSRQNLATDTSQIIEIKMRIM